MISMIKQQLLLRKFLTQSSYLKAGKWLQRQLTGQISNSNSIVKLMQLFKRCSVLANIILHKYEIAGQIPQFNIADLTTASIGCLLHLI